ncbi:hypothetical protein ACP3TG_09355 [Phytobacter diazotrophicus]
MAAKTIVEIDVNDEKFQAFIEKFNEYQAALSELPDAWRAQATGIADSTRETNRATSQSTQLANAFNDGLAAITGIVDRLDRINENLGEANKRQDELNKKAGSSGSLFSKLTRDAKSFSGHVRDATTSLLSWGGILGVFTGVLGAGGLFGINRLAATTSTQRFTSLGLGTSIGGLDSSAINYQKALGNPVATLGAIRDSQADLSRRWTFQAMGINNPDRSPDQLLPEMIRNARDIYVKNGSTLQGAQAHGLTNFFTLDDLNRFKNMSDAEINAMEKRAQRDARLLQISDQQARQWQDFNIQLDYSGQSIRNTFVRGLAPLAPALTKLSDALTSAIDTVLKSPELGKWIDNLSGGIQRFGNYLASPEFSTDVDSFMDAIKRMAHTIGRLVDLATGKISAVEFFKESTPMLSDEPVKDPLTGKSYIPGTDNDPRVSTGLKWIRRLFETGSIKPIDSQPPNVNASGRTIADRFNNPTNLRWAEGYGTHNTRSGDFAVFPTLDEGVLAAAKQLQIYGSRGVNTVSDIAKKWAPSNENDTAEYIRHVVRTTRFGENEKLDLNNPAVLAKLISAMSQKEGAGYRVSEGAVIQIFNNTGGNAVVSSAQLGVTG